MSALRARQLRNSMTEPEVMLWSHLKLLRAEGFHFRRQAPFEGYYLDFACFSRRVAVELDGSHHQANDVQAEHDMVRDAILKRSGFVVLRFHNGAVRARLSGVVSEIMGCLAGRPLVRGGKEVEGA
jgi:very-short-patch-repair endonuclease